MPSMDTYRNLDQEEIDALQAFATAHKRKADRHAGSLNWKDELSMVYWYNARVWKGPIPGMGNLLHAIRNEFGPTWLYEVCKIKP